MAETVPFVKPAAVIRQSQFFGHSVAGCRYTGSNISRANPTAALRPFRTVRNLGVFAANLAGLTTGTGRDTLTTSMTSIAWKKRPLTTFAAP